LARALRRQALGKGADESKVEAGELEGVVRRNRLRWERNRLVRAGMKRAQRLGWPNNLYVHKKSRRVHPRAAWKRFADSCRAAFHCGEFDPHTVFRLE